MPHMPYSVEQWRTQRSTVEQQLRQTLVCSLDELQEEELAVELGRLCTGLLDYLSTGHFSIYTRPLLKSGRDRVGQQVKRRTKDPAIHSGLLNEICRHIGNSTDQVLSFNEKYEAMAADCIPGSLHGDLKRLHRTLSLRYALEEQLLVL